MCGSHDLRSAVGISHEVVIYWLKIISANNTNLLLWVSVISCPSFEVPHSCLAEAFFISGHDVDTSTFLQIVKRRVFKCRKNGTLYPAVFRRTTANFGECESSSVLRNKIASSFLSQQRRFEIHKMKNYILQLTGTSEEVNTRPRSLSGQAERRMECKNWEHSKCNKDIGGGAN